MLNKHKLIISRGIYWSIIDMPKTHLLNLSKYVLSNQLFIYHLKVIVKNWSEHIFRDLDLNNFITVS